VEGVLPFVRGGMEGCKPPRKGGSVTTFQALSAPRSSKWMDVNLLEKVEALLPFRRSALLARAKGWM